jgi:hypothetical protein
MKHFININNRKLLNATYGCDNIYIIVTRIIKDLFKKDIDIKINNSLFNKDPVKNKVKELILYFDDLKLIINENDYILFYKEPYIKSNLNKNSITYHFNDSKENKIILTTYLKDELNIIEWICYHLTIGFDKILIIDLQSAKDVNKIIKNFNLSNYVDIINYNKYDVNKIMNSVIMPYLKKNTFEYFINLDANEYINLNNKFSNVKDLLCTYNYPEALVIHSVNFGSNNLNVNKSNNLLTEFKKSDDLLSYNYKTFFKINNISYFLNCKLVSDDIKYSNINNIKYCTSNKFKENIYPIHKKLECLNCYINNYCIQSKEEFMRRKVYRENINLKKQEIFNDTILNKYNNFDNNNLNELYSEFISNLKIKSRIKLGFIILRCVRNKKCKYEWIRCYNSIRKFYDNKFPIMIVDDNSIDDYILDIQLENVLVVKSIFKKRGEILPYYYYLKNKFCERAVILHDSMIIENYYNYIDIENYNNYTRLFLFHNDAYKKDIKKIYQFTKYLKNGEVIYKYHLRNLNNLFGCFGVCFVIDYDYLLKLNNEYNIINLVNCISTRIDRKNLERLFSLICLYDQNLHNFKTLKSLFGSIHKNVKKSKLGIDVKIKKNFFGR